jgi:cysteine synthase B
VAGLIGRTPLVEIRRPPVDLSPSVRVFAKLEGLNPGGSVKDRAAWNMLKRGLETGELDDDKVILDSTSGNTGIALAMLGASLGLEVELVMPGNVSLERKRIVSAYGARPVFSDALEGSDGALLKCRDIYEADPGR